MATYSVEDPVSFDLCCPICFEDYDILSRQRAPKLLLCLHTFCLGCARRLWRADGTLECSLCRTVHSEVALEDLFDNPVILQHLRKKGEELDLELARKLDKELRGRARSPEPTLEVIDITSPIVQQDDRQDREIEAAAVVAAAAAVAASIPQVTEAAAAAVEAAAAAAVEAAAAAAVEAAASLTTIQECQQRHIMGSQEVMGNRAPTAVHVQPMPQEVEQEEADQSIIFDDFGLPDELFPLSSDTEEEEEDEEEGGSDYDGLPLVFGQCPHEAEVEVVDEDEDEHEMLWMPPGLAGERPSEGEDAGLPDVEVQAEEEEEDDEEEGEDHEEEEEEEEEDEAEEEEDEAEEEEEEEEEDRWHSASDDVTFSLLEHDFMDDMDDDSPPDFLDWFISY